MKAALFLTVGSLVSSTFALHARHADFHHKKRGDIAPLQYECCKTVVTVTVYEDEPTSTATVHQTNVNTVLETPKVAAVQQKAPVVAAAPSAAAPSAAAPATGGAGVVANGNKWAMTYTPYDATGGCKDGPAVALDVAAIKAKGFTTLRIYGTDCGTLDTVPPAARANGMKLIVGVFIKKEGIGAAASQVTDISSWGAKGNWDMVVMIIVGNEAIHQQFVDGPGLAGFISSAKSAFQAAGSGNIPVTTTEVVSTLIANKAALCPVIDVVGANIQTFFDGSVVAANAGDFVLSQLDLIKAACPGKIAYNLESGWPSAGGSNGASVASSDAQAAAIKSIVEKAGANSVIFSHQDDHWKAPGIEQNFGCGHLF